MYHFNFFNLFNEFLGRKSATQTVCMNVVTYVCFCLIHFLKIVNFMQVQAPQIVVQYDYNIYVYSFRIF